jgi:hypothetical protein
MKNVFKNFNNKIEEIKNNILPNNTKDLISLHNSMSEYINKKILDEPYKLHRYLKGGSKDDDLNKIMKTYSNIDINNVYNKLVNTTSLLNDIQQNLKNKQNKQNKQKGGYGFMEFNIPIIGIEQFYVPVDVQPTIFVSETYPNFYMDDYDCIVNRLCALKVLSNNKYVDTFGFVDHVQFMIDTNLQFTHDYVYRYIDKNILDYNINLIEKIISEHDDFYNKFKLTLDVLRVFCIEFKNHIGDNIFDISLLTPHLVSSNNELMMNLNYGLTLLNSFKKLMDSIKN